ncbi:MAG: hypothetical protein KDC34_14450 [Saprospiraceae bacterium]|nr:hypothetical protein [Saprospiraceae bacterium]
MQNSRLIQLLNPLSRREMTRFREFSESPYHNKHLDVRQLIEYLSLVYPQFDENRCHRTVLFEQLFPGEVFDFHRLSVVFSYAVRLLESFYKMESFSEEYAAQSRLLLQRLRKDDQSVLYQKRLQEFQTQTEKEPVRNSNYHLEAFYAFREADIDYRRKGKHEWDPNLQKKQDQLDCFFISEKLRDHCELVIRKQILKGNYEKHLLAEILDHVGQRLDYFNQIPAVIIYYQLYFLLIGNPDQTLEKTLTSLQKLEAYFPRSEREDLYNMLLNYCIDRINQGMNEYHARALLIIKWQLEQELIFQKGRLPEWHYKNIVTIALRAGELEWVRQFIEQYKSSLHPDSAERAYKFNLASYYYTVGQPERTLELLAHLEYNDPRYYLATKALLLRTYYDLQEYEALRALSEAFQQNMKRNKRMTDDRIQGLNNLFRYTKKAMAIKNKMDYQPNNRSKQELEKLADQITGTQAIINRPWLQDKVGELQKMLP